MKIGYFSFIDIVGTQEAILKEGHTLNVIGGIKWAIVIL